MTAVAVHPSSIVNCLMAESVAFGFLHVDVSTYKNRYGKDAVHITDFNWKIFETFEK
jgi:hypothetical protein